MGRVPDTPTISGAELRRRIDRLGLNYIEAAPRLGLTVDGLQKQMRAVHRVSRQTELLLKCLEKHQPRRARVVRVNVKTTQTKLRLPRIEESR
jgi:hypothetical protein